TRGRAGALAPGSSTHDRTAAHENPDPSALRATFWRRTCECAEARLHATAASLAADQRASADGKPARRRWRARRRTPRRRPRPSCRRRPHLRTAETRVGVVGLDDSDVLVRTTRGLTARSADTPASRRRAARHPEPCEPFSRRPVTSGSDYTI